MTALLLRHIIPAAYSLLPSAMASDAATAMLIAIARQESRIEHRIQIRGPARGFWQFERGGGIAGVLAHPRSCGPIADALDVLCYQPGGDACYTAVAHNDVLAACFARCLLWTLPAALPTRGDHNESWRQYMESWRPGKPHPASWNAYFDEAWTLVAGSEDV